MVTCPQCGGSQLRKITPSYFVCATQTLRGVEPGAAQRPVYMECGFEFQVAGAAEGPSCFCGLQSIGACRECGMTVCGVHGQVMGHRFLCPQHIVEVLEERQRVREQDELARRERDRALGWLFVSEGHAARLLRIAGRPLEPFKEWQSTGGGRGWFGQKRERHEEAPTGEGWSLGQMPWSWEVYLNYGETRTDRGLRPTFLLHKHRDRVVNEVKFSAPGGIHYEWTTHWEQARLHDRGVAEAVARRVYELCGQQPPTGFDA